MALQARARAMCVLPVPGGPMNRTPPWSAMKRVVARSRMSGLGILGLKLQLNVSRVITWGMRACLRRRAKSRSRRRASSSSTSSSRNSTYARWPDTASWLRTGRACTKPDRRRWRSLRSSSGFTVAVTFFPPVAGLAPSHAERQLGVLLERADELVLLGQPGRGLGSTFGSGLDQAVQGAVAEAAVVECDAAGPVHPLLGVRPGQAEHALEQPVGADVALLDGGPGPGQGLVADPFGAGQQVLLVGLLAGRLVRRPLPRPGRNEDALTVFAGMNADLLAVVEDAHQAVVPAHPDFLTEQVEGGR